MSKPLSRLYKASFTPDHTATAYSDGDAFGVALLSAEVHELSQRSIVIREIHVTDLEKVTNNDLDLYFFNDTFTKGTDNGAFAVAAADSGKRVGAVVEVAAANYVDNGGFEKAIKEDVDIHVPLVGRTLYLQAVAGAAFDSTGTSQVTIDVIYERQD